MLDLIANALVIAGGGLLVSALFPTGRLIQQIPQGSVRRRWQVLAALTGVLIAGYLGYLTFFWSRHSDPSTLIVPAIFFGGGGFVRLAASLSLQTALDIRRVVRLEHETITDPLLGLYNRRYLDRRLEEEVVRARRYGLALSVLLLDIDRFKRVNDEFGHQVGDLALNHLGKLILQVIRKVDVAARYGGEELLIIAPNTAVDDAAVLGERLRQHVETHPLAVARARGPRREVRLTVSIGVAGLTAEVAGSGDLIALADAAQYRAKLGGRNRVVVQSPGQPAEAQQPQPSAPGSLAPAPGP